MWKEVNLECNCVPDSWAQLVSLLWQASPAYVCHLYELFVLSLCNVSGNEGSGQNIWTNVFDLSVYQWAAM